MVENIVTLSVERFKKFRWGKIFYMFYIEPVVFVLVFAHSLSGTIIKNQMIYQACATVFNYNESDCLELGTNNHSDRISHIETEVQQYIADLFMIRTLLESIVPAICGVFIGSWSDHYGRKPLLLISMIGFSFTYIINAIICEISHYYPVNPWYYILAVVPHSVLGGNCVFSVAAFCFLSDITNTKTRPDRMISMEAFFFIGLMGGSLLSSFVYAATSATITFTISGLLMCGATVFIWLCVPESLHLKRDEASGAEEEVVKCKDVQLECDLILEANVPSKDMDVSKEKPKEVETGGKVPNVTEVAKENIKETKAAKGNEKETEAAKSNTNPEAEKVAGLFSYVHIKDMLSTCFKARPHYDRCIIWLITGTMFLSIFVIDGAMTVFYLFVREKFHWTVRDFTFFETVSHMVPMFGAIVGFIILRKIFKVNVVVLAIIAFVSDILISVTRGLAAEPWHMYLSIALGAFKSIGGPMCRTIVSNIVPATDLGKIFSIKNILQSIAPFLAAPLYTFIYKQSLTTFPGLFNLVSAALYTTAVVFLVVVLRFKYSHKAYYANILK